VDELPAIQTLVRLGHESLDVTLAYLKDKDAESEEALGARKQQQLCAVRIKAKQHHRRISVRPS
jgi:hypothetical protein